MDSFYRRLEAALASAYTIERELTGGGMSHVYLATEKALGRTVVVKVLPPDLAAGVNRERFRREIHLAAQLQHPHIVPLLTAGEDGDLLYYTMPFVSGESLKVRLEERGALPIRDVVRILTDVVDALAYAHARGVVHRDIKPGNVLTQRSHALVTDFGVAKALSASLPAVGATTSGLAIGTPAYMAPEQLAADPAADHRVDLYAVGLLAYELLTGEAPFAGASPTATMAAQLTRDPDPIETRRPDVPAELSAIVRTCLAKDPAKRPPTADALLASLEELPAAALTPTRSTPVRGTMMGRRGGRAGLLAGGFTALLLLGILLGRRVGAAGNVSPGPDTLPVVLAGDSVEPVALVGDSADAGPSPDASPAPATVLTRADSMAIAEAVQRRLARENATRGRGEAIVNEDSLTQLVSRVMIDSLLRVAQLTRDERFARIRGLDTRIFVMTPDSGARSWSWSGPRPITVVPLIAPNDPGARAVHAMADTLRRVLARSRRFVPRDADVPGEDRSDLVATVQLQEIRGDSVRIRIELIDPLAEPSLMHRVVSGRPAASADQLRGAEDLARSAATTLTQMSRSPRRPPSTVEFHAPEIPTPPDPSR